MLHKNNAGFCTPCGVTSMDVTPLVEHNCRLKLRYYMYVYAHFVLPSILQKTYISRIGLWTIRFNGYRRPYQHDKAYGGN